MEVASSTAAAQSGSTGARSTLSANFDTFLQLLTKQLQYQDPTQPMDTAQFTQQLVQYSQVEQQINTNKNLESLVSLQRNSAASAALGYLGRTVTTKGDLADLRAGAANWTYELPAPAAENQLVVTNARGQIVRTLTGALSAGKTEFQWDGKAQNGDVLPDGVYRLEVRAKGENGQKLTAALTSTGAVTETDMTGPDPVLKIGARKAALADVVAIKSF